MLSRGELFGTSNATTRKLQNQVFTASDKTINRIDKDINNIIAEGYEEGVGVKEVGRRIKKRFNKLEGYEANRIARTEMHSAHVQGMLKSYEDIDVQYLKWNSKEDSRTRDSHRSLIPGTSNKGLDGQIIPVGGTFSNGLQYPGDRSGPIREWINCRCTPSPFLMPLDKIAPPGMGYFYEEDLVNIPKPFKDNGPQPVTIERQNHIEETISEQFNISYDKYITKDRRHILQVKSIKNPENYITSLKEAAETIPVKDRWRVTIPENLEEFISEEPNKMFITKNGSVATITKNGDIINVCANKKTKPHDSSRALLEYAVKEGGIKLDSFDGNYGFYRRCGFEPVSWCDFVEEFAPTGWKKEYLKEPIIFFKYTGKTTKYEKPEKFYAAVKKSKDYDTAKYKRDKEIK